jgi:hypothetical protein
MPTPPPRADASSHHNIPHGLQQSRSFPTVHYRSATQRQRTIALWRRILLFILIVRWMQPADGDGRHDDKRFRGFTAFGHSGSMHTHTYFAAFLDGRGSCRRGTGSEEHRCQLWTTLIREAPALALFVCEDYTINRYVCSCKFRKNKQCARPARTHRRNSKITSSKAHSQSR